MKKSVHLLMMLVALGISFGCAAVSLGQRPLAGGYKEVATDDPGVVAAAEFAVSAKKEQQDGPLSLVSIERAERQTVAGTNYRICMQVKAADETDAGEEPQGVKVVVFRSLQNKYELKSWEEADCDESNSEGHHASSFYFSQAQSNDELHTPAEGSDERKAILDAVRDEYKEGEDHPSDFKVNYLKAHNGWAWIDVTPLDAEGKQIADPAPLLFNKDNGKWAARDLNDVGMEGDEHEGPHDPSPKYIKALLKKYPGLPADIIPKGHR